MVEIEAALIERAAILVTIVSSMKVRFSLDKGQK